MNKYIIYKKAKELFLSEKPLSDENKKFYRTFIKNSLSTKDKWKFRYYFTLQALAIVGITYFGIIYFFFMTDSILINNLDARIGFILINIFAYAYAIDLSVKQLFNLETEMQKTALKTFIENYNLFKNTNNQEVKDDRN